MYSGVSTLKFAGSFKWVLPIKDIEDNICDSGERYTEAKIKVMATVTDHSNGEKVEGYSVARVTRKSLNMGFSVPSPSMFHHDMPFHTMVSVITLHIILNGLK